MTVLKNFGSIALGMVLVALVRAQDPGPMPGRDSLPWNPANWALTTRAIGKDTISSWHLVNGSPTNQITEIAWSSNQVYPLPGALNATNSPRDVFMKSEGEAILSIQWVGVGPSPPHLLLRITSFAWAGTKPIGTLSVNNGLGSTITVEEADPELFDVVHSQFGTVLRRVELDANGRAEIRLEKLAFASATGLPAHSYADARTTQQAIAVRTLEITGEPNPTYTLGFHDAPVPNKQEDPTVLKMDIGIDVLGYGNGIPPLGPPYAYGTARAVFRALPWGFWNQPFGSWTWADSLPFDWKVADLLREFSKDQVVAMIKNGPIALTNKFWIDDADHITERGQVDIRIHAPWEFPIWTTNKEEHDDFARVGAWVVRNPYGPTTLTESSAHATATKWKVTIGISGSELEAAHPLLQALSIGGEYGQTATLTTTQSYTYTVGAGPSNMEFCVEKQNLWGKKTGWFLAYDINGYAGLRDMEQIYWLSGSKAAAERADHRYKLGFREHRG